MNFIEKLNHVIENKNSILAIGLDADLEKLPAFLMDFEAPVTEFNKSIINATSDIACAYKLNMAFYEQFGIQGIRALKKTIELIPDDTLIIIDGKRGDVGHSSSKYAKALFHEFGAHAITINPYLGYDSVEPFLQDQEKGAFLLCLTSNPGAHDFQYLPCNGSRLFEKVAEKAVSWNSKGNVGLVVGATHANELQTIRKIAPELPILLPGVGAQGGDLETSIRFGTSPDGDGLIVTVSRHIIYASAEMDFASKARDVAIQLRDRMNQLRQ